LSTLGDYTLTIDLSTHKKARSAMRRQIRSSRSPKSLPPLHNTTRCYLAIAVVTLFVGVCLGRLCAPEVPLFRELLPIAAGLLGLVVRYYFVGHEPE
jgi:hypothetical protein